MSDAPSAKPAAPRTAYLVLGMHRSGTSAVTQLLALAGASLPANVMPEDEHNAKGYFEPWKIALFNESRLRASGSAWDDIFAFPYRALPPGDEEAWVAQAGQLFDAEFRRSAFPLMKDPRATVLLPLWRRVLETRGVQARCVIPVRHPLAVAGSLARRDGFAPQKSVLVWSSYMLAAEAYARGLPCAMVGYDALLSDWRGEVARIEAAHGAPLPRLTPAASKKIDAFLTPELRHNSAGGGLAELGWAGEIAAHVLGWFEAAARGEAPDRAPLEHAAAELARRQADVGPLTNMAALAEARAALAAAEERLASAEAVAADLRQEIDRQREVLEAGWREAQDLAQDNYRRLDHAQTLLAQVNLVLDEALAEG